MARPSAGYLTLTPEPVPTRVMRRIAPLATTLIAACALATSHASAQAPAGDAGRLAQFLPIARAAWPGSPCAGREQVHLSGDTALRAAAPAVAGSGGALNGMARPQTCEVWLASTMDARMFCTVLVHELGHLAGRDHTATPGDVMNGAGDSATCRATASPTRPPSRSRRSCAPCCPRRAPPGGSRAAPRRAGNRRCVARRGRSVRRYDVTEARSSITVSRDH